MKKYWIICSKQLTKTQQEIFVSNTLIPKGICRCGIGPLYYVEEKNGVIFLSKVSDEYIKDDESYFRYVVQNDKKVHKNGWDKKANKYIGSKLYNRLEN